MENEASSVFDATKEIKAINVDDDLKLMADVMDVTSNIEVPYEESKPIKISQIRTSGLSGAALIAYRKKRNKKNKTAKKSRKTNRKKR